MRMRGEGEINQGNIGEEKNVHENYLIKIFYDTLLAMYSMWQYSRDISTLIHIMMAIRLNA